MSKQTTFQSLCRNVSNNNNTVKRSHHTINTTTSLHQLVSNLHHQTSHAFQRTSHYISSLPRKGYFQAKRTITSLVHNNDLLNCHSNYNYNYHDAHRRQFQTFSKLNLPPASTSTSSALFHHDDDDENIIFDEEEEDIYELGDSNDYDYDYHNNRPRNKNNFHSKSQHQTKAQSHYKNLSNDIQNNYQHVSSLHDLLEQEFRHILRKNKQQTSSSSQSTTSSSTNTNTHTHIKNDDNHHQPPISNKNTYMAQLLQNYSKNNPPLPKVSQNEIQQDSTVHKLSPQELHSYQLWLECESQQDYITKFESIMESARSRQDYTSISTVQKQLLEWYPPIRDIIASQQKMYLNDKQKDRLLDMNKYGPFLCTLQPEKLAILTCYEAFAFALTKNGSEGTLMNMALRIGNAVEAEVNVQKLLRKRMLEKEKKNSKSKTASMETDMNQDDHVESNNNQYENAISDGIDSGNSNNQMKQTENNDQPKKVDGWMYLASHLQTFIDEINKSNPSNKRRLRVERANKRASQLLESNDEWTTSEKIKLGVALIKILLDTAKVTTLRGGGGGNGSGEQRNAFTYEKRWTSHKKLVGHVILDEELYRMCAEDKFQSLSPFTRRHQPMVVPPVAWTSPDEGGYHALKTDLMRTHGCQLQKDAIYESDLSTIFDGLNVLGRVPWKINKKILSIAQRCWDECIVLGDIPSRVDFDVPPQPIPPEYHPELSTDRSSEASKAQYEEYRKYREAMVKHKKVNQKNMDLRSLRCSALLKLDQAEKFKDFEKIYFPYNVDFRGRAYPIPPHFSNVGSDLCRGMLKFSESKPLGPRGLYWLKVHLANLAGANKMSFDDRAAFADKNMDNILDAVNDPFGENRWWMSLDDPFQALATCHEIVAAIASGDPESYECSLPVHMDGSCNGLQHYAALGRDKIGGKAVNLCNYNKPQDVYIGVMEEVIRRVAEEASMDLHHIDESNVSELSRTDKEALKNNRAAKLVNGLIDRGVVKRTVMTSVYGVTYIGAKKQIQEKIEEKLLAKGYDVDEIENEIHVACGYLAKVTMEVMGELFTGARMTMNWLATCARLISSQGQPVSWVSPIGIPAVQPYRQKQQYSVVTLIQRVILVSNTDSLPIHKQRQASAFPPNYVHSLDSSHMLLTALEMDRRALTFSAVHDSFWTHACDIDEMNSVLRQCFVDLYNQPLLEELKKTWELQYPALEFPELPKRGELDLNEVKSAPYFFQ